MAGSIETKTISASNLKLKLKLTEAELGNKLSWVGGGGSIETKAISASNLKLKLTEAELGKLMYKDGRKIIDNTIQIREFFDFMMPHPHLIRIYLVILCCEECYIEDILKLGIFCLWTFDNFFLVCISF